MVNRQHQEQLSPAFLTYFAGSRLLFTAFTLLLILLQPESATAEGQPSSLPSPPLRIYGGTALGATTSKAVREVFLKMLVSTKHGDPTGLDTFTHFEYVDELEEVRKKGVSGIFKPPYSTLMAMVESLANDAKVAYNKHSSAIDKLLSELKANDGPEEKSSPQKEILEKYRDNAYGVRTAIMACKTHILGVFSPGGHAYFLRVHSFAEQGAQEPSGLFGALAKVYRVAKLQSDYLDKDVNEQIIGEHMRTKKLEKDGTGSTVVVIGGGPIGRWATYLAFKAGFNALNLERNRRVDSQRRRVSRLDSIWTEQLRYFLGKLFDEYTAEWTSNSATTENNDGGHDIGGDGKKKEEWALIYFDPVGWQLFTEIHIVEEVLYRRVEALKEHLASKRLDNDTKKKSPTNVDREVEEDFPLPKGAATVELEQMEEVEVVRVMFPFSSSQKGAMAGDLEHYRVLIHDRKERKLSKEEEEIQGGAAAEAFLQQQEQQKRFFTKRFRVMINAAGASRNKMRDLYMGIPEQYTFPRTFFALATERGNRAKNVMFSAERAHLDMEFLATKSTANLPRLAELMRFFHANEMDAIIDFYQLGEGSCPAIDTMAAHARLGTDIFARATTAAATTSGSPATADNDDGFFELPGVFNMRDTMHMFGAPPRELAAFNRGLREEMKRRGILGAAADACHEMRDKVNDYFFAATAKLAAFRHAESRETLHPDAKNFINVDGGGWVIPREKDKDFDYALIMDSGRGSNLNKQVFVVTQSIPRQGADYFLVQKNDDGVAVGGNGAEIAFHFLIGDAGGENNFNTGTGLSTGRWSAEAEIGLLAAITPAEWAHGLTEAKARFIVEEQLSEVLYPLHENLLKRGRMYAEVIVSAKRRDELTTARACRFINEELCSEKGRCFTGGKEEDGNAALIRNLEKFDFVIECIPVETHGAVQPLAAGISPPPYQSCVEPSCPNFRLHLHGGTTVAAKVTEAGRFAVCMAAANNNNPSVTWQQQWWYEFEALGKAALHATMGVPPPQPPWERPAGSLLGVGGNSGKRTISGIFGSAGRHFRRLLQLACCGCCCG